jgi:hypothetical protein
LINTFAVNPLGIYQAFPWFDIPMHILGGMVIAFSIISVLRLYKNKVIIKNRFLEILIILGLFSLIAIFWEFYEYLSRIILNITPGTIEDTLSDFMFGLIGALIISLKIKKVTTIK